MTILEQLATTKEPAWIEMVELRRVQIVASSTSTAPHMGEWGRKGGSHYKDGQFTKK